MRKIILALCLIFLSFNILKAETISKNEMFLNRPDNQISFLKTENSLTIFEQSPNKKQCKLTNVITSRDEVNNSVIYSSLGIYIDANKSDMGVPKFYLDSKIRIVKDGEEYKDQKWEKTVTYLGQTSQENLFLFAPYWRMDNSKEKTLTLGLQKIDIVGDIKEYINSLRELIGYSLEKSILDPSINRPSDNTKSVKFPYQVFFDTKLHSYTTQLAFSPNKFSQFAECAEPILFEAMKSSVLYLGSRLKPNLYLTCSGKEPVMNIDLPVLNIKIDFHKGVSTVNQGISYLKYAVNNHDNVKSIIQFGKSKKMSSIFSYRWNNTPQNLLNTQDSMFKGYDVYSRFMVSNFIKKNNVWLHMQLYRSLDYKPEIWQRKCSIKDKKWWKRVTFGIKGIKD